MVFDASHSGATCSFKCAGMNQRHTREKPPETDNQPTRRDLRAVGVPPSFTSLKGVHPIPKVAFSFNHGPKAYKKGTQRLAETNGKPIAHPTIDQHHARMRFRRPAALPPPTKSTIAWRGGGSDQSLRPLPPKRQTSTCSRSVNTGLRLRA